MNEVRQSTSPVAVPRGVVLRPFSVESAAFSNVLRSSDHQRQPSALQNQISMLSSPKILIRKYGFRSGHQNSCDGDPGQISNLDEPDEWRTLAVVAVSERQEYDGNQAEEQHGDRCAFVNKEYLAAWNPALRTLLHAEGVEEAAFPGPKSQLDAMLRCVLPCGVWPLSLDVLKEAIGACCEWGMHESLVSTIAFYLHNNPNVCVTEKLKMASQCGDPLLLTGALRLQCRRDTIFDLVNRSPDEYRRIVDGAYAAAVTGKMLEHAARDGDEAYLETLSDALREESCKFKNRCKQLLDFSRNACEQQCDEGSRNETAVSKFCLLISEQREGARDEAPACRYYVDRSYLSSWSPVFRSMFYGDFADRRRREIVLELGEDNERCWRLFLTLLHPSHACALWRLLPMEYCRSPIAQSSCSSANSTRRSSRLLSDANACNGIREADSYLDVVFSIIFEDDVEALMQIFRLAHKFQVSALIDFCVFMIEFKSGMTLADKILLADTYHLPDLMAWCVGKLTTARSVKRMFSENEDLLSNLSCNTHKILLERMLELV